MTRKRPFRAVGPPKAGFEALLAGIEGAGIGLDPALRR